MKTLPYVFAGLQLVVNEHGDYGFRDERRHVVIPCEFSDFKFTAEPSVTDDGREITFEKGKLLAASKFVDGNPIPQWGVINDKGETVCSFVYEDAKVLRDGLIAFRHEGEYAIVDVDYDALVRDYTYNSVGECFEDVICVEKDGLWGLINDQGVEVVPCELESIRSFEDGIAKAVKDDNVIYLDKEGNEYNEAEAEIMRSGYRQVQEKKAEFAEKVAETKSSEELTKLASQAKIEIEAMRDHAKAEIKKQRALNSLEQERENVLEMIRKL